MTRLCQTGITECAEKAVDTAVWYTMCQHKTTDYCPKHRDRILRLQARPGSVIKCSECEANGYREDKTMKEMVPIPMHDWDRHRDEWIARGGLATKDAMVAAVTLDYPENWDTFGSLLADAAPAAPAATGGKCPAGWSMKICWGSWGSGFVFATILWLSLVMAGVIH